MRHRYTRQELEQLPLPRPLWIEGIGFHQLQWGGWEVATHIHNGRLCIKHEPQGDGLLLELYDKYWTAWDGAPEGEEDTALGQETNADRIRAMNDEELLDFMKKSVGNAYMCKIMRTEPMFLTLDWLQQPAEEDT